MYGIFIGNHLEENNVSYIEHCCFSMHLSNMMAVSSLKACIHAIIPGCFPTSSTELKYSLNIMLH